jgi:hypothetical protein
VIGHAPFATNAGSRYAIRFLRRWQNYFRGDVASFPMRMAIRLVERGYAEAVNIIETDTPPEGAQWALRPPGNPPPRRGSGEDEEFI